MVINISQDILSRCHQRHENPLKQKKTKSVPRLYKGLPYSFTVNCAQNYPMLLQDLELAGISFMPIGQAPGNDRPPRHFGGERFLKRQQATDWNTVRWHRSWGIQIYTGEPSARDGAQWHDISFKYEALCVAPDAVIACVQALLDSVSNPLLTISKSGGLRFSCRIPDYLHPNTNQARFYVYKQTQNAGKPKPIDAYIEILGEKGYNCWDARYEILQGNLLDPPVISKEVFFAPIDALRATLHEPIPDPTQYQESSQNTPQALGSCKLDLAKEAFLKRGFSYFKEENGLHYWRDNKGDTGNIEVSLWEKDDGVWMCASTSDKGLPNEATLITDVWDNTGILPPLPTTGIPVNEKMLSVRKGKRSPLAIRRPMPILQKSKIPDNAPETFQEIKGKIQNAFDRNVKVLGFTQKTDSAKNTMAETLQHKDETICLKVTDTELADEATRFILSSDIGTAKRWRNRMYLWHRIKHISVNERMANPFQRGNVCEDPERCQELEKRGGNPDESICPHCPVYTQCKERGYLSQYTTLQTANALVTDNEQLCLDPQYANTVEQLLETHDEKKPLFIVKSSRENRLFLKCELSKTVLDEWATNWQGEALGNFALVLLNALRIRDKSHVNYIRRLRTTVQTFEWLEKEIIKQMCNIKVRGRVVTRSLTKETGKELAQFRIEFEGGISAYVPLDAACADIMETQKIPFYQLNSFVPDENMSILMPIADAIRLGILDTTNVDSIQEFPTVCKDSNWTYWHQLKRFFEHYPRDTDAPIEWEDEVLRFWVPPVLHPSVKHLLVTAPLLSPEHLRRVFLDSETECLDTRTVQWLPGNQVFQIRTGTFPQRTIVDTNNTWDVFGFSETGQQIFWRIQAEIERDTSIKHGIIAHPHAYDQLTDIERYENVSFLTFFRKTEDLENDFQEAQVIWIVGLPDMGPNAILRRTRILYGNHEKPLSYEMEPQYYHYKDERVQSVYEITNFRLFKEIIDMAQLNRIGNKKIMMITSLRIPFITDRPETLLFDWEDFEIADGLDKLTEAITTRQRFEAEREKLTAESSRKTVESVLGCSSRQASRVLQKLRGGKLERVPFREQIVALLADGEMTTPEITDAIAGHPKAINTELTRLVNRGEIVKVKRGVYTLPKT